MMTSVHTCGFTVIIINLLIFSLSQQLITFSDAGAVNSIRHFYTVALPTARSLLVIEARTYKLE